MALDRIKIAEDFGWTLREVYMAIDCHRAMMKRCPDSSMTIFEYFSLMRNSGIRPSMIGLNRGKYSIARINDSGNYDIGNCRFILIEENIAERKEGYQKDPKFRKRMSEIALSRNREKCCNCGKEVTPQMLARWHGDVCNVNVKA